MELMETEYIDRNSHHINFFVLEDVIICQSVVRKHSASRKTAALRRQRLIRRVLLVVRRLQGYAIRRRFLITQANVVCIQSIVRRWGSVRKYQEMKMAATKIASIWRGHTQHISYRRTLNGMTFTSDILSAYMFWYLFTHTASSSSHQV